MVAGCVPQADRNLPELEGVSILGVQQIDRVVEVVEQTLQVTNRPSCSIGL